MVVAITAVMLGVVYICVCVRQTWWLKTASVVAQTKKDYKFVYNWLNV